MLFLNGITIICLFTYHDLFFFFFFNQYSRYYFITMNNYSTAMLSFDTRLFYYKIIIISIAIAPIIYQLFVILLLWLSLLQHVLDAIPKVFPGNLDELFQVIRPPQLRVIRVGQSLPSRIHSFVHIFSFIFYHFIHVPTSRMCARPVWTARPRMSRKTATPTLPYVAFRSMSAACICTATLFACVALPVCPCVLPLCRLRLHFQSDPLYSLHRQSALSTALTILNLPGRQAELLAPGFEPMGHQLPGDLNYWAGWFVGSNLLIRI